MAESKKYSMEITFSNGEVLQLKGSSRLHARYLISSKTPLKAIYKKYGLITEEAKRFFMSEICYDYQTRKNTDVVAECYLRNVKDLDKDPIKIRCSIKEA